MFGIISNMVFKIASKESAHMFLSLYSLLSKLKGAAAEYERSCGCFLPSLHEAQLHTTSFNEGSGGTHRS